MGYFQVTPGGRRQFQEQHIREWEVRNVAVAKRQLICRKCYLELSPFVAKIQNF